MKFIHAADLHLDSPLRGLARYEGAPIEQMQTATRRAFINLVDLACQEQVDFVLLVGDLYDGDWKDYNTGLFFNQQMSRLRECDIPVFIVYGNHDAGSSITKQLRLPDNVKEFNTRQPETVILEELGVAIHGQSFPQRSVTEDLRANYPTALPNYYNIGLLHTSVNGRKGHDTYAPCSQEDLLSHGYDYWALGHVHTREILHENPYIVFPGNLQGRHVRETGAKGCTLITVNDAQTQIKHCPVDVLRWEVCALDVSRVIDTEELINKVQASVIYYTQHADNKPLALRFVIEGACPIHDELHRQPEKWINEIRTAATDAGLDTVWVEKIYLNTHAIQHTTAQEEGPLLELMETLRDLPNDHEMLETLGAELRGLKNALPVEARYGKTEENIDPEHPDTVKQLLTSVEEMLLARLFVRE